MKTKFLIISLLFGSILFAQKNTEIYVSFNLNEVKDDKIQVTVNLPKLSSNSWATLLCSGFLLSTLSFWTSSFII